MLIKKNDIGKKMELDKALAHGMTLEEVQDALVELAEMISNQDDALVELADVLTEE